MLVDAMLVEGLGAGDHVLWSSRQYKKIDILHLARMFFIAGGQTLRVDGRDFHSVRDVVRVYGENAGKVLREVCHGPL